MSNEYIPIKLESVSKTGLKASQEKNFRKQLLEDIPKIEEVIDKIWPKKANLLTGKKNYILYFINDEPCFIQPKEGPIIPHLKLLHKYPFLLPSCQVDKGGIKHIIGGANVMIPGLLSKGGKLPTEKEIPHNIVAVNCEGMENALAIGQMQMSPEEMKEKEKGIAIEVITYIGDEAWNIK
jgi:predicted RNA-binding protein (TIGR00451 family)